MANQLMCQYDIADMDSSPSLHNRLSRITWLRRLVRLIVALGDNVRPIVQRPLIAEYIGPGPLGQVFDCGCGTGMYTQLLLPKAEHVSALDFSAESIARVKLRYSKYSYLDTYVGSATDIPLPDGKFDLVLHCEVLEHIQEDQKALSEISRVTKPGGRLIISVPHPPAPIDDPNHVREGYTLEQLTEKLNAVGFTVEKHRYCMFGLSKFLMKFETDIYNKVRLPLPAFVYWPLFLERALSKNWGIEKQPYDVIVQARKAKS